VIRPNWLLHHTCCFSDGNACVDRVTIRPLSRNGKSDKDIVSDDQSETDCLMPDSTGWFAIASGLVADSSAERPFARATIGA
jgi:hypothetical protein